MVKVKDCSVKVVFSYTAVCLCYICMYIDVTPTHTHPHFLLDCNAQCIPYCGIQPKRYEEY